MTYQCVLQGGCPLPGPHLTGSAAAAVMGGTHRQMHCHLHVCSCQPDNHCVPSVASAHVSPGRRAHHYGEGRYVGHFPGRLHIPYLQCQSDDLLPPVPQGVSDAVGLHGMEPLVV
jgi:hypothetical protein